MDPQVAEHASFAELKRSFAILCLVPAGTGAARPERQSKLDPDTGR